MNKKIAEALRNLTGPAETENSAVLDALETLSLTDGRLTRDVEPGAGLLSSAAALMIIRIAAALDCKISKELLKELRASFKIQPAMSLLRDGFSALISPPHGPRGLKLAIESELIRCVLGVGVWENARRGERDEFMTLAENLESARPEVAYRWALIFRRFDKKRMEEAVLALKFDKDTETKLLKTLTYTDKIYFLNTKVEFKRFIKRCGFDDYYFIDRVARQEKKIFDRRDLKVENRLYILEEIRSRGEPLALSDLAIGEDELIENGVCADREDCARILSSLLDLVIIKPERNTPAVLLKEAARVKRNPLRILTNKVNWIK
jgi:hypothetical protein